MEVLVDAKAGYVSECSGVPSDRELLAIQMSVHWYVDEERRIHGGRPQLVVACSRDETTAAVRSSIANDLAARLFALLDQGAQPSHGQPPSALYQCQELLDEASATQLNLSGGPSYLVGPPLEIEDPGTILRSDSDDAQSVLRIRPGNWQPVEWHELVSGGAGAPWAMVVEHNRVVSICHTAARSSTGAEAGTWTDPSFRGRGYAAATTAAWADLASAECPYLFYSTSIENRSSQRVAERLGLRHIGWLWKLTRS